MHVSPQKATIAAKRYRLSDQDFPLIVAVIVPRDPLLTTVISQSNCHQNTIKRHRNDNWLWLDKIFKIIIQLGMSGYWKILEGNHGSMLLCVYNLASTDINLPTRPNYNMRLFPRRGRQNIASCVTWRWLHVHVNPWESAKSPYKNKKKEAVFLKTRMPIWQYKDYLLNPQDLYLIPEVHCMYMNC
jgi:hypothetical protein